MQNLNRRIKNENILSFLSTKIDYAELAGKFGGGGHKGAAGFSTESLIF